jgi:hypothetical protein
LTFTAFLASLGGSFNSLKNMKFPPILAALVCAGLMAAPLPLSSQPAPPASPAATNLSGPRLTFAAKEHHFGKIMGGEKVKCVYLFTNTGDQTLVISSVAPGCHCTTVGDWSKAHQIEPGQTGEIPIQFDSGSFRGTLSRTIAVTSNDKLAPRQTLLLDCTIWKPFEISPAFVRINVVPDGTSNATSVVHITSESEEPVTLSNPASSNDKFKAELKTIKEGKEFEVAITALPPFAHGNTAGAITVNTSLTNVPVINITVTAFTPPAVVVSPQQIPLSPQIVRWTTNLIKITSNWNKALALSDPQVSDTRVTVALKEITPGHEFQLAAAFPPGYQIAPGQKVELSVKSDNPDRPVITVPISQFHPHPSASVPPAMPKVMSQNPPPPPPTVHP